MRVPGTKIYRAFSELNEYSDEQCRRFMRAANRSFAGRVLRAGGILGVVLIVFVLGFWALLHVMEAIENSRAMRGWAGTAAISGMVGGLGFVAILSGLFTRDVLLWRRIRRVIRTRGNCPSCGYRLMGLVVSAQSTVACPECGEVTKVDPSLAELARGEEGRGMVVASIGEEAVPSFWTPWRRRFVRRASLAVAALVLGIPLALLAAREYVVRVDALRAASAEDKAGRILELTDELFGPEGADNTASVSHGVALEMMQVYQAFRVGAYRRFPTLASSWPMGIPVDTYGMDELEPPGPTRAMSIVFPPAMFGFIRDPAGEISIHAERVMEREYARAVLDAMLAAGIEERIESVANATQGVPRRSRLEYVAFEDLRSLIDVVRLHSAMTRAAMEERDMPKVWERLERDRKIGDRLRGLDVAFPGASHRHDLAFSRRLMYEMEWASDAGTIARLEQMVPELMSAERLEKSVELSGLRTRESVIELFKQRDLIRFGLFSRRLRIDLWIQTSEPRELLEIHWEHPFGRLRPCLELVERGTAHAIAQAAKDPWDRQANPHDPTVYLLLRMMGRPGELQMVIESSRRTMFNAVRVRGALERHRLAYGEYPRSLAELTLPAETLIDANNGKWFGYLPPDPSVGRMKSVLYSLGRDGLDRRCGWNSEGESPGRLTGERGDDYPLMGALE